MSSSLADSQSKYVLSSWSEMYESEMSESVWLSSDLSKKSIFIFLKRSHNLGRHTAQHRAVQCN